MKTGFSNDVRMLSDFPKVEGIHVLSRHSVIRQPLKFWNVGLNLKSRFVCDFYNTYSVCLACVFF